MSVQKTTQNNGALVNKYLHLPQIGDGMYRGVSEQGDLNYVQTLQSGVAIIEGESRTKSERQ